MLSFMLNIGPNAIHCREAHVQLASKHVEQQLCHVML